MKWRPGSVRKERGLRRSRQRHGKWRPVSRGTHHCSPSLRHGDPDRQTQAWRETSSVCSSGTSDAAWLLAPSFDSHQGPTYCSSLTKHMHMGVHSCTHSHTQTHTAGIPSPNTALPEPVLVQFRQRLRSPRVWPPNPGSYLVSPLLPPWSGSSLGAGLEDMLTPCSLPVQ